MTPTPFIRGTLRAKFAPGVRDRAGDVSAISTAFSLEGKPGASLPCRACQPCALRPLSCVSALVGARFANVQNCTSSTRVVTYFHTLQRLRRHPAAWTQGRRLYRRTQRHHLHPRESHLFYTKTNPTPPHHHPLLSPERGFFRAVSQILAYIGGMHHSSASCCARCRLVPMSDVSQYLITSSTSAGS